MLMGIASFTAGLGQTINVALFGLAPTPDNFLPVGTIQQPSDVSGTLPNAALGGTTNEQLRGTSAEAGDTITPDAALGTSFDASNFDGPGLSNEFTLELIYDGLVVPPGFVSVVRAVWKGVDILVFCDFAAE